MKTRNLFAAALIAAMAFTSCSSEEDITTGNDPNIVRFRTSVDGMPMTKAAIGGDGSGYFVDGDVWGVYGKIDTPLSWPLDNSAYTVGTTTLYWDHISMDQPVTFSAYYPSISTIADPTAYVFNVATAVEPDLLVATPVTVSKGETVNLNFKHTMHKLAISLDISDVINDVSFDVLECEIIGMKSSAKVNLLTGEVDYAGASGTDSYDKKWALIAEWIVAPQDLVAGTPWIRLSGNGKTYTFKVPADLGLGNSSNPTRLESGRRTDIQLVLKSGGTGTMSVAAVSEIAGWGTWQQMPGVDVTED